MLSGGGRTSMLWDTENRLTSVTNSGVTETYGYDADGERITRTNSSVTTVYLGGLWEETSGGAVKQYYPFNGTVVAVRDSSAGVSYLHGDHLGSVSATSGMQAGGQTFGPWGNVTSGGSSATARNYTGQYLDGTSGLLYYHARYYDATLARFISADSVVPGQTATSGAPNPQQLNRYSYVTNNPLTYNDPSGHAVSDGKDGPVGPVEGAGGGSGPDAPLPDYPERPTQGSSELGGMTMESDGSVHPTGQSQAQSPKDIGNNVHYDQLNGGTGTKLPSELQAHYPDTEFRFARRGAKGANVEYQGGTHPSQYSESEWPEGMDHGDFKPNTPYSAKNFYKEINSGKLPDDTVPLPYDPGTGKLLNQTHFGPK